MPSWIPWLIAIASTTVFVAVWFWEVKRTMQRLKSTVDSAADQLKALRLRVCDSKDSEQSDEIEKVIGRSKSIYLQAVKHYNDALDKPWIFLPGIILGFKKELGKPI